MIIIIHSKHLWILQTNRLKVQCWLKIGTLKPAGLRFFDAHMQCILGYGIHVDVIQAIYSDFIL